jgi:hypothetical protein
MFRFLEYAVAFRVLCGFRKLYLVNGLSFVFRMTMFEKILDTPPPATHASENREVWSVLCLLERPRRKTHVCVFLVFQDPHVSVVLILLALLRSAPTYEAQAAILERDGFVSCAPRLQTCSCPTIKLVPHFIAPPLLKTSLRVTFELAVRNSKRTSDVRRARRLRTHGLDCFSF